MFHTENKMLKLKDSPGTIQGLPFVPLLDCINFWIVDTAWKKNVILKKKLINANMNFSVTKETNLKYQT